MSHAEIELICNTAKTKITAGSSTPPCPRRLPAPGHSQRPCREGSSARSGAPWRFPRSPRPESRAAVLRARVSRPRPGSPKTFSPHAPTPGQRPASPGRPPGSITAGFVVAPCRGRRTGEARQCPRPRLVHPPTSVLGFLPRFPWAQSGPTGACPSHDSRGWEAACSLWGAVLVGPSAARQSVRGSVMRVRSSSQILFFTQLIPELFCDPISRHFILSCYFPGAPPVNDEMSGPGCLPLSSGQASMSPRCHPSLSCPAPSAAGLGISRFSRRCSRAGGTGVGRGGRTAPPPQGNNSAFSSSLRLVVRRGSRVHQEDRAEDLR